MDLEVGKCKAVVTSSADTFTACIYGICFTCVDFNRIIQFIERIASKFQNDFKKKSLN